MREKTKPPKPVDTPRQDSARQDSARQDSARQDSARQDSARQDSARQDSARQDSARQDSARQDRTGKKPTEQDGSADHWREATLPTLEALRKLLRAAGLSQHQVEARAGFSRGYLSQLLTCNLDLKMWHVLAILDAVECRPADFFHRLYPGQRQFPALEKFRRTSQPLSAETDELLAGLYGSGVESLNELRDRLSRCEEAVSQLEEKGLFDKRSVPGLGEES